MLKEWIRLIQNGSDVSLANQDEAATLFEGTTVIHMGKKAAFNNFYAWMDIVNASPAIMKVEYWTGKEYVEVVDLLDGSEGFTKSGVIQFSPNKNYKWKLIQDTSDEDGMGLEAFTIYDMYWLKITFNSDLDLGTSVKRLAYKFTDKGELLMIDNAIDNFLPAFSGQTDWIPQMLSASVKTARELKRKLIIKDEGQVLRFEDVAIPAAYKTMSIIYQNLGESYTDRRKEMDEFFHKSFTRVYTIDKNGDGAVSTSEQSNSTQRMTR